jgi:hypothetical protein
MPDYAGAVAAIKARVAANWTTTPVGWGNDANEPTKFDGSGDPSAWVYGEVINTSSDIEGVGKPGSQTWRYDGLIYLHVFVPVSSGTVTAFQYAVSLGEIFRGALFYDNGVGDFVRSWSPRVDGGDSGSDDGLWWRVTATIPFQYWHRG